MWAWIVLGPIALFFAVITGWGALLIALYTIKCLVQMLVALLTVVERKLASYT